MSLLRRPFALNIIFIKDYYLFEDARNEFNEKRIFTELKKKYNSKYVNIQLSVLKIPYQYKTL